MSSRVRLHFIVDDVLSCDVARTEAEVAVRCEGHWGVSVLG